MKKVQKETIDGAPYNRVHSIVRKIWEDKFGKKTIQSNFFQANLYSVQQDNIKLGKK